jgi:TolB-like protein/DNA-binding winged helix-turn-helix (wHTH) protein
LGVPIGVVKFAEFELDGGRYELRRGGSVLKLEKIPMELLLLLVESDGRLVTREEIVERIWGKDVFLDTEHGINTAIRKIRQTLADDPENPRFVQTVTGKGYRFVAAATTTPAGGNGKPGTPGPVVAGEPYVATRSAQQGSGVGTTAGVTAATGPRPELGGGLRLRLLALIASVGIVAVLIGLNVGGVRDRFFSRSPRPRIHSLAVLPLENLSADPAQEYFADGMTDELITMLAKNPELKVVSRTSVMQYKKVHRPLADVARELGVDGILEGSVERSGTRVHINTQLIYAPQDRHLWAESYDRDLNDLTSMQSELARAIARQVGLTTSPAPLPERRIGAEAHDAYLLGKYYWYGEQYEKSREYFEKAIGLQPDYAAAWASLADSYIANVVMGAPPADMQEAMAKAEPAARKALALDGSLAEAHGTTAAYHYFFAWDWEVADRESARAVELDPGSSMAHHLRAYVLTTLQRTDEAIQEERKSMELDPFVRPWALGFTLVRARQFDAAEKELRARSEVQPNDCSVHSFLRDVYRYKGMAAEAVQEWAQCLDTKSAAELQSAFRRGGPHAVFEWRLARFNRIAAKDYVSPLAFAHVYAELGRKEETLRSLERAYKERVPWLVHLQNDPDFDFVHSDPRYQAIVKGMRLPPG